MKATLRLPRSGENITISENFIDRVVRYFSPVTGARRFQARAMTALAGGYVAGSRSRRSMSRWNPRGGDADGDILLDLPTMRDRSRDLVRNAPLATGALNTVCTNVVGAGLKLQAGLDYTALGISEEAADEWEATTEREFRLWANSKDCDIERGSNFHELQDLAFRSTFENGDSFAILPHVMRKTSPFGLKIQLIEADRVCNENNKRDTSRISGGVEKNKYGAPLAYFILSSHPGSIKTGTKKKWRRLRAFGAQTGRRIVVHLLQKKRIGQTRGVPYFAPVMETLKQLDRYTDAEVMAAVVSGMFTVFLKTEGDPESLLKDIHDTDMSGTSAMAADNELALGNGSVVGLAPGEDISTAAPGRPNTAFDPFMLAILRQVGVALELPFEVLNKHFTASYSAARAAMLEAWKFYISRRTWLARNFCQPVYEAWMDEAVAIGRVSAPGYFQDPLIRALYLSAQWIGPGKGMINEKVEIDAAKKRVDMGVTTLTEETASLNGGDWEDKHRRAVKETKMRLKDGLARKDPEKYEQANEWRKKHGLDEMPSGNAVFLPANEIPALKEDK